MKFLSSIVFLMVLLVSVVTQAANCTISTTRSYVEIGYYNGYIRVYYDLNSYTSYCGGTLGSSDSLTVNLTSGNSDILHACRSGGAFNCSSYQPSSSHFADITVYAGAGDDHVDWLPINIPAFVYGEAGADDIQGGSVDDWLDGGDGCDSICGMQGDDTIFLGSLFGSDGCSGPSPQNTANTLFACYNMTYNDTIYGSYGDDFIGGQLGADYIWGGPGDDTIHGFWGVDVIDGGPGDDDIFGGLSNSTSEINGNGYDLLIGNTGNDTLIGNPSSGDCLCGENCSSSNSGTDGNDTMIAWSGNDYLCDANTNDTDVFTCGNGTDIWYVNNAGDTRTNCETYSSTACSYCRSWSTESAEAQFDVALSRMGISKAELDSYANEYAENNLL